MFARAEGLVIVSLLSFGCSSSAPSAEATPASDPAADADTDAAPADAASEVASDSPSYEGIDGLEVYSAICPHDGKVVARYRDVPVYCLTNASSATGFYQCDEFANRFMRDAFKHPELDNVVTEFASQMCTLADKDPAYSVWGPKHRDAVGHAPVPGDLLIFKGAPGHVAVVTRVGADRIDLVQQNGPALARVSWDATTSTPGSMAGEPYECWIHPEPAAPAAPPSGAACACPAGDGDYCGLALIDWSWWYGCALPNADGAAIDTKHLYTCTGGTLTTKRACDDCFDGSYKKPTGTCRDTP